MRIPVIRLCRMKLDEFVDFWSQFYEDVREGLYTTNIEKPLTPDRVRALYCWKNGGELSKSKSQSVERNVVTRLPELGRLQWDKPPLDFLLRFAGGGMIWRIFFLHIWQPGKYPICDRHVYRAMHFIKCSRIEEIAQGYGSVARMYVDEYIPFFNGFPPRSGRRVDKALFAFGKFLKSPYGKRAVVTDGGQGA